MEDTSSLQPAVQTPHSIPATHSNSSGMVDIMSTGFGMPHYGHNNMPTLVSSSSLSGTTVPLDSAPLIYPASSCVQVYTSCDSTGSYFPTQSSSQPTVFQSSMNMPSTVFTGSQPFVTAVQPGYPTFNQQFAATAASASLYGGFGGPDAVYYGSYANGSPYDQNGALVNFNDPSINFVGQQLANTTLNDHAGNSGVYGSNQVPMNASTENANGSQYAGHHHETRRRRATANADGTDFYNYQRGGSSRRHENRPPSYNRYRNFETPAFRREGHNHNVIHDNRSAFTSKRQRDAPAKVKSTTVFSENDFPSLNDSLKPQKPNVTNSSGNECPRPDENANEVENQVESDANVDSKQPETTSVGEDEADTNEINKTVEELVSRLRPMVDARCSRPFADCLPPEGSRFFIIKSNSEDDVYRSLKYSIWCSTPHGNTRLQRAFSETCDSSQATISVRDGESTPLVMLLFSVNGSGHFCGVARMRSAVDLNARAGVWVSDRFTGRFDVEWLYIKDVPNAALRHIRVDPQSVVASDSDGVLKTAFTHQRDCTEIGRREALEALRVMHEFNSQTTIFDDARFYEQRERAASRSTGLTGAEMPHPSALVDAEGQKAKVNDRHNSAPTPTPMSITSLETIHQKPESDSDSNGSRVSYASVVNPVSQSQRNYANVVSGATKASATDANSASVGKSINSH